MFLQTLFSNRNHGRPRTTILFQQEEPEFGWLCQWYPSRFTAEVNGQVVEFRYAEQQVFKLFGTKINATDIRSDICCTRKTLTFSDRETREKLRSPPLYGIANPSAEQPKDLMRRSGTSTDSKWSRKAVTRSIPVVLTQMRKELKQKLLEAGGRELVEASPFDQVWGIGFTAEQAKRGKKSGSGKIRWGKNLLGLALMNTRRRIREEEAKLTAAGDAKKTE